MCDQIRQPPAPASGLQRASRTAGPALSATAAEAAAPAWQAAQSRAATPAGSTQAPASSAPAKALTGPASADDFAHLANRSLAKLGGYGKPHLTARWEAVPPRERASVLPAVESQLRTRLGNLSAEAATAARTGNPSQLARVEAGLRAARDLQEVVGLPAVSIDPTAAAELTAALTQRVELLERDAAGVVSRASITGVPATSLWGDIPDRVGGLRTLLGIVQDPGLRARVDAVLPSISRTLRFPSPQAAAG